MNVSRVSITYLREHPDTPRLCEEYADECSIPALGRYVPQWETYMMLERSLKLTAYGAFQDEHLIGFAVMLVSVYPHSGALAATVESLFVSQPKRVTGAGTLLMKRMEEYAKHKHCKAILYSAPAESVLEEILERHADRTSSVFCKAFAD